MNDMCVFVPPVVCPFEDAVYRHLRTNQAFNGEMGKGRLVVRAEPDLYQCNVGFFMGYTGEEHSQCRIAAFPHGDGEVSWPKERVRVVPSSALGEEIYGKCPSLIGLSREERLRILRSFGI